MKFSIIIPCKEINSYVEECMAYCLKQSCRNFEILLLPDLKTNMRFQKTKIISTGKVKPGIKRNLAAKKARGEILAFIDSDAFPEKDWLKNSIKYFKSNSIGAVGGPNLTPKDDSMMQKASGDVLANFLTGKSSLRYRIGRRFCKVNELPSCNLLVKREVFEKTSGYDPTLLTAEDSKLCFDIAKLRKKVIYAPDVVVFHHRRKLFKQHLKQIWIYGRDIAWLTKKDFSFSKLYYSLLSIFVLALIAGAVLSFFNPMIRTIYFVAVLFYLVVVLISSLAQKISRAFLIFFGLILTHISYGLGFLCGLFSRKK